MNFTPKQYLELDNFIKYVDEILHKCDKGIEFCKICPNEFVCAELEKDDFGLENSTISEVLTAIQHALNKVPGYLNPEKRNDLREHIQQYINESPVHERGVWEDSILDLLLDGKLADPSYKPTAKISETRVLLTYNARISFSTHLNCLYLKNDHIRTHAAFHLPPENTANCARIVSRYIQAKHPEIPSLPTTGDIKYCLGKNMPEILRKCDLNETGLAAALCFYSTLIRSPIPGNIAITGGLDMDGGSPPADHLDDKIGMVLRELHFIDTIIIPTGSSFRTRVPDSVQMVEVNGLEQAADAVFKSDFSI